MIADVTNINTPSSRCRAVLAVPLRIALPPLRIWSGGFTGLIVIFIVSAALSGTAQANIYSFKDEQGVTHFSNLPHLDKRYKLVYRIPDAWQTRPNAWTPSFPKSINIEKLVPIIDNAARMHGVDPRLVHAVIRAESGYNERALSNKGAVGLMQLIPATAERMGVRNIYDPVENIFGGTRYLAMLLKMFNNDMELALAGYNAGEGAVQRYGNKIPPFAETQAYVPKVLSFYRSPELNRFVSAPMPAAVATPMANAPLPNTRQAAPALAPRAASSQVATAQQTSRPASAAKPPSPKTPPPSTLFVTPAPPVISQPVDPLAR